MLHPPSGLDPRNQTASRPSNASKPSGHNKIERQALPEHEPRSWHRARAFGPGPTCQGGREDQQARRCGARLPPGAWDNRDPRSLTRLETVQPVGSVRGGRGDWTLNHDRCDADRNGSPARRGSRRRSAERCARTYGRLGANLAPALDQVPLALMIADGILATGRSALPHRLAHAFRLPNTAPTVSARISDDHG